MNRQWLRQLINCTTKIYHLPQLIKLYKDSRKNPDISPKAVCLSVLFGFLFRMPSFERLKSWIQYGKFNRMAKEFKLPSIDVIRDSLKETDLSQLQQMNTQVVQKARRNKVLRNGTLNGWIVSAIDGVELFENTKKQGEHCLTRVIDGVTHYYYSFVGCMTIGKDPRILWGMEAQWARDGNQKDEGEITAAKRLVKSLYERFHHFTDILVCDALYAKSTFINLVRGYNIHLIIRMKDQRLHIVKDALGLFSKRLPDHTWKEKRKNQVIHIKAWQEWDMQMNGVQENVRFVRYIEKIQTLSHGRTIKEETKEVMLITTCDEQVTLEDLWEMIHKRWDIENCLFHQQKTHWHMDHRFVDGQNAICACISFLMMAFNLWNLYLFRYLRNYNPKKHPQVSVAERMKVECEIDQDLPVLLAPG